MVKKKNRSSLFKEKRYPKLSFRLIYIAYNFFFYINVALRILRMKFSHKCLKNIFEYVFHVYN